MVDDDFVGHKTNSANSPTNNGNDFVHAKSILPLMNELPFRDQTCVVIGRVFFNDKVDTSKLSLAQGGKLLDPESFSTLKFHSHLNKVGPLPAKVMLDVSKLDESDMRVSNPHAGISPACKKEGYSSWPPRTTVRVHHYLGTKDDFLLRRDERRDADGFEAKAKQFGGRWGELDKRVTDDDDISGWVEEFINGVGGGATATEDLDRVGKWDKWPEEGVEVKGEESANGDDEV